VGKGVRGGRGVNKKREEGIGREGEETMFLFIQVNRENLD
jgi:hypothetical protein